MKADKEKSLLTLNNPSMTLWFKDKFLKSFFHIKYVAIASAGIDDHEVACTLCGLEAFAKANAEHDVIGKSFSHGAYIKANGEFVPVHSVEYEPEKISRLLLENTGLSLIATDNKGMHYLV